MAKRTSTPVYLQVAVDMAGKICREELKVGQKISGRTTIAGEYNVSPETVRKAMKILADVNIVQVKHGNGIYVSSVDMAEVFIERYRIRTSVNELKDELVDLMKQRDAIENKMNETMQSIIDYTGRFKNSDYISVHEYFIDIDQLSENKTLRELDLKHQTGITVVGIVRNGVTMLSPDDEEVIKEKDKILYVGIPSSSVRLGEYLRNVLV